MTDQGNTAWVNDVTYGPGDEMQTMTASTFTETRTYNANLQLTELISGTNVHLKYNYSASQNNGQIVSQQDLVSGETISYQYDSLKRLVQASATGDPSGSWAQNFGYDGFGNLTNKTSTNAPQLSVAVDWATNRIQSFAGYDANGNLTGYAGDGYSYDLQNRMIQASVSGAGTVIYGYDTTNHRTYKAGYSNGTYSSEEFYFYRVEGHKYGTWKINASSGVLLQASVTKQWFGGRLVSPEDRLGSKGKYFAFGEERTNVTPANPPNDQEKFATYTRDSATGLDYANQRYYSSIVGRFTRPDPYGGSASFGNPQSWNRYSYVGNDPSNLLDPKGAEPCGPGIDFCTTVYGNSPGAIPGYFTRSSAKEEYFYSDTGYSYSDPLLGLDAKQTKTYLRSAVSDGLLSDCQALVAFVSHAYEEGDQSAVYTALGEFVPADNLNVQQAGLAAKSTNADNFLLDSGNANVSGFYSMYQNSDENGIAGPHLDQAHHFATFFQLGYKFGYLAALLAPAIDNPFTNSGDVFLGIAGASLGDAFARAALGFTDVAGQLSNLCDPNWTPRNK